MQTADCPSCGQALEPGTSAGQVAFPEREALDAILDRCRLEVEMNLRAERDYPGLDGGPGIRRAVSTLVRDIHTWAEEHADHRANRKIGES